MQQPVPTMPTVDIHVFCKKNANGLPSFEYVDQDESTTRVWFEFRTLANDKYCIPVDKYMRDGVGRTSKLSIVYFYEIRTETTHYLDTYPVYFPIPAIWW